MSVCDPQQPHEEEKVCMCNPCTAGGREAIIGAAVILDPDSRRNPSSRDDSIRYPTSKGGVR